MTYTVLSIDMFARCRVRDGCVVVVVSSALFNISLILGHCSEFLGFDPGWRMRIRAHVADCGDSMSVPVPDSLACRGVDADVSTVGDAGCGVAGRVELFFLF